MSSKEEKDFDLFVKEAEEIIRKIEDSVLNLEENFKDNDPVEKLYFAFHNLKGMTAMVGLDNFSKLCHFLENLLDKNKDYEKRSTTKDELIALLFESHDVMRNLIKNVKSGDQNDLNNQILNEFEKRINNLEGPSSSEEYEITFFKPVSKDELERIKSKGDHKFYNIYIEIQETCVFKKVRLYIIFRALNEIGRICSSDPEPSLLEKGAIDKDFEVYFMSTNDKKSIIDTLNEILEIETRTVNEINSDEFYSLIKEYSEQMERKKKQPQPVEETSAEQSQGQAISSVIADDFDDQNKITSIKVDIKTLETLMDYFGELVILKNQISQILQERRKGKEGTKMFDDMDKLFLEIQEIIFQLKLVRVEKTFRRYRRLVRDVAKETGKQVKFILKGLDVEIDRKVLEELNSPLIHLLRNAIYHGIESPKERKRKNKDVVGTLRLESYRKAGSIYIKVKDDGRGLNFEKIRRKTITKGLYSPEEAEKLTKQQLKNMLFKSGFSTVKGADEISGRGMGLAIVDEKVEDLGGSVEVRTKEGKGTEFILDVPFTRAILKAQLFKVGGDLFAIPIENINQIYFFNRENIDYVKGIKHYQVESDLVPAIHLDEYLDINNSKGKNELGMEESTTLSNKVAIWCKKDENNSVVLIVDKILQQMEIVIKPFKSRFSKFRSILGVSITGEGKICMVIDVMNLISSLSTEELTENAIIQQ